MITGFTDLVNQGKFDDALIVFKQAVPLWYKGKNLRDKRIADRITNIAKNKNNQIVVRFGAEHSDIYHILRKRGLSVERLYDLQKGSMFYFAPITILERKMRLTGYQPSGELEWMKWMLAQQVYSANVAKYKMSGEEVDSPNASRRALVEIDKTIRTMGDVRKLESTLRKPSRRKFWKR